MESRTPVALQPEPPESIRPTLLTYLLLTALVVGPVMVMLSPFGVSLVTGGILAVLCYPLYARLRRRLPQWAAALAVTLGLVVLVIVPVLLLSVGAYRQGSLIALQLAQNAPPTLADSVATVRRWAPFVDTFGTPEELALMLQSAIGSVSQVASASALRRVQGIPQALVQIALCVLSVYFLLVDGRRALVWVGGKLPLSAPIRERLIASFRGATNAVVLASVAAAGAQALVMLIGFWALGVPAALLATGATFILGWVPALPTLVWGAAAVYLYQQESPGRAAIMVGVGLVVGIVDNIVRPIVLRGQKAMHPMISLVGILGGIALYGIAGVFIGPLLVFMAIAVLDIWPAVATFCGIPVSGSGDEVPDVPMLDAHLAGRLAERPPPSVGGEA